MRHFSRQGVRAFQMTRAGNIHSTPTDISNEASSALAGASAGATFVTLRTSDGALEHTLVTGSSQSQESVAFAIAQAMNSRSTEVDEVPDLGAAGGFAYAVVDADARPMPDTQAGATFVTLSRIVANLLMEGEWVAVSIRKPSARSESRKYAKWLDHHGIRTHHSLVPGAVVMSLYAGGKTADRARDIVVRVAGGIPAFGLTVHARKVSLSASALQWLSSGLVAAGLGVTAVGLGSAWSWLLFGLAAVGVLGGVAVWRQLLPSPYRTLLRHLSWGVVPVSPSRLFPPRRPRAERLVPSKDGGEPIRKPEFGGDYPLASSAFMVGPHIPLALIAPHSGSSGSSTTATHPAPNVMLQRRGAPLGWNGEKLVYLDAAEAFSGVGLLGQAGSGKTAMLEHMWGVASLHRTNPTQGVLGSPLHHAMIALDTKGDGLATLQYDRWLEHNGDDKKLIVHVLDPTCPVGVELFPVLVGESVAQWARKVVSALVYIWGEDSIGARSFDTLLRVLEAGLVLSSAPEVTGTVTLSKLPADASPFFYADVLLTNRGDALGVELAAAIKNASADPYNLKAPIFAWVWERLAPMYDEKKTPAQRGQLVDAPRTKVAALMSAEHWWSRGTRYTWSSLLNAGTAVVLNTGIGPSGYLPDDKLREDISGLLIYTLREDIRRTCVGWFEQDYAVSIFADEVKHIANTNDQVIRALRDDDRALGVRCVFATQTPETLKPEVRGTLLGFGTLILFRQEAKETVDKLVGDLAQSGGNWDASDVVNLPKYHAIVRATADGRRHDPFTVAVPNWRQMRDEGVWAP